VPDESDDREAALDVVVPREVDDLPGRDAGTADRPTLDEIGQLDLCDVECGLAVVGLVGHVDGEKVDDVVRFEPVLELLAGGLGRRRRGARHEVPRHRLALR
jgi:hypothetical protein